MSEFISNIFGLKSRHRQSEPELKPTNADILPFDVRYALQYRGGMLNRAEIMQLARHPAYTEAAFYLSARALRHNPDAQKDHITRYLNNVLTNVGDNKKIADDLSASIKEIPLDTEVDASKLAEISRQGSETRAAAYRKLSEEIEQEGKTPVLVAHAALEGLSSFFPKCSQLNVVSPHWFGKPEHPIGYAISTKDKVAQVSFIHNKHELPTSAVFVDDTLNEGGTKQAVTSFMGTNVDFRVINTVAAS